MCPYCGGKSFSAEKNADFETKADMVCRACWWERHVERISQVFDMMESSPNIGRTVDGEPWAYQGIAPLDPGMCRGEKRRVVKKSEPMAG